MASLLLDDYTKENGTTRLVPGSHKYLKPPDEDGYFFQDHPNQIYVEAPRGSLLIYDINIWHRGSKNLNGKKEDILILTIEIELFGNKLILRKN